MSDSSGRFTISHLHIRPALDLIATVLAIGASVAVLWLAFGRVSAARPVPTEKALPTAAVPINPSHLLGDDDAPVVIIEYSDFQCPFCKQFATDTFPKLNRAFVATGKVQFAFRHFPLTNHPLARPAALATECAGRQQRFWPMHDGLFAEQQLAESTFAILAHSLKLNERAFNACFAEGDKALQTDQAVTKALGITGTPAFLIGRRQTGGNVILTERISGAGTFERFQKAIEKALNAGNKS